MACCDGSNDQGNRNQKKKDQKEKYDPLRRVNHGMTQTVDYVATVLPDTALLPIASDFYNPALRDSTGEGRMPQSACGTQADGSGRGPGADSDPPPSPHGEDGSCEICQSALRRSRWTLWLACQDCHVVACMGCLELDASTEDGPVELLCRACKETRRQQHLTAELEELFQDLRESQFDESLVVELSNIEYRRLQSGRGECASHHARGELGEGSSFPHSNGESS